MIGIVFGAGYSIDFLPDRFFDLIRDGAFLSLGVNSAVFSKRIARAQYKCDGYVMADSMSEERDRRREHEILQQELRKKKDVILYVDKTWGLEASRETKLKVWHNSGELAARILAHEHKCSEIWLIGMDGAGPHCETTLNTDRFARVWDMTAARGACFAMNDGKPPIWQQVVDDCKVPFKVFPHWSLLHPYIVPNAIRIVDNCDEVIFE